MTIQQAPRMAGTRSQESAIEASDLNLHSRLMRSRRLAALCAVPCVTLILTACGGGQSSTTSDVPVALAADRQPVEQPVRGARLTPGTRYQFQDLVPSELDLELTAPSPALYNYSDATVAVLSTEPELASGHDALWFIDIANLAVPTDPYFSPESIAGPEDLARAMRTPPDDVLGHFATLPFVRVTRPQRAVVIAGVRGRAVDIRIRELPRKAVKCAFGSLRRCATITILPGIGQTVLSGQRYRIMVLRAGDAQVLVVQDLGAAVAQKVLDTISLVPAA